MTKLSILALTTRLALAGVSVPVLPAPIATGNVPLCTTGSDSTVLDQQKDNLATELQLSTKPGSSIDVWNGCLKVMSTEAGKTTVAFYDPDTLQLVATI